MEAEQVAAAFVAHATVLLTVNLTQETDPVLAGFLPDRVPEADDLLDDTVLVTEVIRAPRGEARLERAVQWFDTVWADHPDRTRLEPLVRAELDRQRHLPAILDLDDAIGRAALLLDTLVGQTACFRDTAALRGVLTAVRRWQADPTQAHLCALDRLCTGIREPAELPSTELVMQIGFFAREGSLTVSDYLSQHFDPAVLLNWELGELTDMLRTRYPLLRRRDVADLVADLAPMPIANCA
ncbi:MAG: hypothetical protein RLY86_442 [Pseudomonadota bacterium]|jgi:hypothetical protein